MAESTSYAGPFISSRDACDEAGYSRPDSFLRSWRRAGFRVFKRRSGRNVVAIADFEKFIEPQDTPATERPFQ